jgi:Tfp pilus assembly protein PilE
MIALACSLLSGEDAIVFLNEFQPRSGRPATWKLEGPTVSEAGPYDEPRLPQDPQGGDEGSLSSFQKGNARPPETLPSIRNVRLLHDYSVRLRSDGIGLIELLNVVLIIGVVVAIVLPMVMGAIQRAREAAAMAYMRSWPAAVELFRQRYNQYPGSLADLTESGFLGFMGSGKVQYTFTLAQKVARAPVPSGQIVANVQQESWWTAVTQWSFVSPAWAGQAPGGDQDGDGNKGHGNNPGGCDPDNPGQGVGGPCNNNNNNNTNGNNGGGNGGSAWEGWATPVGGKGKHFYIDETGTIRYSVDTSANASSPQI